MGSTGHLVRRFVGSLRPGGPRRVDRDWVGGRLSPAELELWQRMPAPDRRHSVAVGRAVERRLGIEAPAEVIAAGILHDVGKRHAGLRTFGRVVATLTIKTAGAAEVATWRQLRGLHRRIALYLDHPRIGADDLELAGSHPLTVAWTREHHRPADEWTVPESYAVVLDACDND